MKDDHRLKHSRVLMVSGLVPYVPDMPLSAGPGKKQNQAAIKLFAVIVK